ncbi:hypothetical protein ABPG75_010172 [Micractinium tetrahymenae]
MEPADTLNGRGADSEEAPIKVVAPHPPASGFARLQRQVLSALHKGWDVTSYYLNCEWLALGHWPSLALLLTIVVGLCFAVGFSAKPIKNAVTLGVEFGGGYTMLYSCVQKENSTVTVTDETLQAQGQAIYDICVSNGLPNSKVSVLRPDKVQVVIPGVDDKEQIAPVLAAFEDLPLGMEIRSAMSMGGDTGSQDLQDTILAAGVAFAIVWGCLVFRYFAAGLLGLFLCVVYIWLHMIFFNASTYALSDAAIVAVVLNIGLGADAHIIAFEQCRLSFATLPRNSPRELGLEALTRALRIAMVTVLEANVSTILAMVVLYGVGTGATVEFAFTVMISVCASMIVNVLLARVLLRLCWNAELMAIGGFFGDKGPNYDDDRRATFTKVQKYVLIPYWKPARKVNTDFIRLWWIGFIATMAVIIAGSVCLGTKGLNWGVDYSAGTSVSMIIPPPYDYTCEDVTKYAQRKSNATVSTCSIADQGHVELRFKDALDPHKVQLIIFRITSVLGGPIVYNESVLGGPIVYNESVLGGPIVYNEYTIDSSLAVEQSRRAIAAMIVAAVVTCAFLLLRFGPGFSAAGFISLASAGLFAICCFAMGGYEVNLPIISAVLTVFSYAINDCVVVFDRIRFEMVHEPQPPSTNPELRAVVNRAMGLVTIRSLLTLAVVMVCSVCLVGLGPQGLESFSLAITFGLLNASYTTILICAPFSYMVRTWVMAYRRRKSGTAGQPGTPPTPPGPKSQHGSKLWGGSSTGSFRRLASTKDSGSSSTEPEVATPAE